MKIELASYNDCTGCGACAASCAHNAIKFDYDKNGFLRPAINKNLCLQCGLCMKCCPVLNDDKTLRHTTQNLRCFTAWTTDDILALKATSGGVFSQIAIDFLQQKKAIVYGAAMTENNTCEHIAATNKIELEPIIGTKYIPSNATWALRDVKKKLKEGYKVLFSGTPCQIAALQHILRTQTKNVLTIELLCHGTPSKLCTDFTLKYYHCKYLICTRNKKLGWYKNRKKITSGLIMKDEYGNLVCSGADNFHRQIRFNYINPSCCRCKYARPERVADIILGDQWGLAEKYLSRSALGASSVIIATEIGLEYLKNRNLHVEENTMETISAPNFFTPSKSLPTLLFADKLYLLNKIALKHAFAFLALDWKKWEILFPIKVMVNLSNIYYEWIEKKITDKQRKNNKWLRK